MTPVRAPALAFSTAVPAEPKRDTEVGTGVLQLVEEQPARREPVSAPATVARPRADVELDLVSAADLRADRRPEEAAETQEVFAAIADLPGDFRLALVAVDIAGLSYVEAAGLLGTREATIA